MKILKTQVSEIDISFNLEYMYVILLRGMEHE
jgi:hypothetical protein